jgi:peptidoglycan pentaglycine glycine transferase (the first glycine)
VALEVCDWTDQQSWDAFVGTQKSGNLNQGWGWGEVVNLLGARVIRRAVVDGSSIKAVMSVASNEVRFTKRRILYVNRGPVVDEPNEEIFGLIADDLRSLAKQENALGSKIEPYVPAQESDWRASLERFGFATLFPPSQPRSQWLIDLEPTVEEIQAQMKPKWRYNVKLAGKRGVEITCGSQSDVPDFHRIYRETAERDGFYIHGEDLYRKIFNVFWELGQFDLVIARLKGKPISAVTLVTLGRTCWYMFGASSNGHRDVMAPHALQWEAMKIAKERGASIYDMRGVSDVPSSDQDMSGVYRFKQGFGGYQVTLMDQYSQGYQQPWFNVWKAYWRGRFAYVALNRHRKGMPHRTWA